MKLYQYAVIYVPKPVGDKPSPEKPKIVVEPTTVLADDEKAATLIAARAIPETYTDKLSECEVAIRPF